MTLATPGLHHVTAIAGDPETNADFYVGVLGLRFVKKTVNHDDTGTYHFYFGDGEGTPGTNITFFPWGDHGQSGWFGAGQTKTTAYLIPQDTLDYWEQRLTAHDVAVERGQRFDEEVLRFDDPHGITLELVATDAESKAIPWDDGPVPADNQLQGIYSVTLAVESFGPTAKILTDVLGFEHEGTEAGRRRYRSVTGGPGSVVDLVETGDSRGRMGAGTVHHVAFEAADVDELQLWGEMLSAEGLEVSEVIDRKYFNSVYAREPGGVLFEMATPEPGFTVDEDVDELGSDLRLPEWLEDERERIEIELLPFDGPSIPAQD